MEAIDVLGEGDASRGLLHRHADLSERQDVAVHELRAIDRHAVPVGVQPAADIGDSTGPAVDFYDRVPP